MSVQFSGNNEPTPIIAPVTPIIPPDMMDGIGILDPQSSCHHPIESSCRVSFNRKFSDSTGLQVGGF